MKTKFFTAAAIAVLLLNIAGLAVGDTLLAKAKKSQTTRIVSLLPASDGVAVFDAKRFLDEALPRILATRQPMLADIMSKINEVNDQTGIDIRKFEQIALGFNIDKANAQNPDVEPVAIVSGDINAGALLALARLGSKGTYREEKIGETTVYIFTIKDAVKGVPANTSNSQIAKTLDKGLSQEIAAAALDQNTLVFGTFDRVRQTLEGGPHIGADITDMVFAKETAIMAFALKIPEGMSKTLALDADELGKDIDAIEYVSGSLDVAAAGTSLQIAARTKKPEQAQGLKSTLEGLQMVGQAILGNSKRADQQVYGRMIKNSKVTVTANDVMLELLVPQSDIDLLIAGVKNAPVVRKRATSVRKHRTLRKSK